MRLEVLTSAPVVALLTITPGSATALVARSAVRGGRRHAFFAALGRLALPNRR